MFSRVRSRSQVKFFGQVPAAEAGWRRSLALPAQRKMGLAVDVIDLRSKARIWSLWQSVSDQIRLGRKSRQATWSFATANP